MWGGLESAEDFSPAASRYTLEAEMFADPHELRDAVRGAYSLAAAQPEVKHPFPVGLQFAESLGYPRELLNQLPPESSGAFAGVSNVSIAAPIQEGMTVVDIGCGAGLDSLIAAPRVGPAGRVIGFDFSAEMLVRAEEARTRCGFPGIHFVQAAAESLPLPDACADLVMINGIFNLNPYRREIFRELARVVRPGGKVAGAELILSEPLPEEVRNSSANWFS